MDRNLLTLISDGFREIRSKAVCHLPLESAVACLENIWNPDHVAIGAFIREACPEKVDLRAYAAPPHSPKRPPPWYIGMTSNFSKAISKIDRTLQGRILKALTEIAESPTTIRGDTVKPLTGPLQGYWRYRLGDDQLIYSPDQSSGNITLLAFASRGSIRDIDAEKEATPQGPTKKVLLLEDRADFREILHDYLVSHSYQVTSVQSGVEGLREIMKGPFDLIVCDMMMPRMGGEMFYWAVTRVRPAAGQRFIFFSGHKNNPKIESFFRQVNATVLFKPFKLQALDSAIRDVFRKLAT